MVQALSQLGAEKERVDLKGVRGKLDSTLRREHMVQKGKLRQPSMGL